MKQRVVAIVQARMRSTRLPGKVLLKVAGKPLLAWQLEQLRRTKSLDDIVIATSGSPADDPLAQFCREHEVALYRGSESDVLDRYCRAAREHAAQVVVRITSDCPLIDPAVIDQVVTAFLEADGGYDFVANTAPPTGSFPDGMDVEVFSMKALEEIWLEARAKDEREHVTFAIWRHPERFRLHRIEAVEDASDVRATVDYEDDLAVIADVISNFEGQIPPLAELVTYLRGRFDDPGRGHHQGEGWTKKKENADASAPLVTLRGDGLFKRAARVIPGGAQTFSKMPAQYVEGVAPKMLVRGAGARVWDADGNEFLDYVLGLGPAILGHGRREVNRAAFDCAQDAFCAPSLPHPLELELAERLCASIPCAEMVRFGKNGSDATAGAVRVARGVTGRDVIACSGYHGWQDWYIGTTTRNCGVPGATSALTRAFAYGDLDSLAQVFAAHPGQVAGVILEPVTLTAPPAGYLEGMRALCDEHGALLIFDEIITGFRLHMGGAQTVYGVTPDLATFGKAIANGYPLSVLCGKREYMQVLEEAFYSFTFGGELPSIAAAMATLDILESESGLQRVHAAGKSLREGIDRAAAAVGLEELRGIGLDFFSGYALKDAPGASALQMQTLLQQELVRRGILTRSCFFVSTEHSPADIDATLQAFEDSARVVKRALDAKNVLGAIQGELIQPVFRAMTQAKR